jgi:hypothetical protein
MAAIILLDPPVTAMPAVLLLHRMPLPTATIIIRTPLSTIHIITTIIHLLHTLLIWAVLHHGPKAVHLEVSTRRRPQVTLSATVHLPMA